MLWLRGLSREAPALILLHGGPGASESALFRHYAAELERHFLVVYWEQRGTGRSFDPDLAPESMTIERFVQDLDEVVELVRSRFAKPRVVLLGHSWGTILGTLYAQRHPEKVSAYVGVGQIASMPEGERVSWEWALARARERGHAKAIRALEEIGPPPHTVDELFVSRHWVEEFGGSFHGDLTTGRMIWAALSTDEASLWDLVQFGRGNRFSHDHLWAEESRLDLTGIVDFEVPVFFLLGRHDWQVPAVVAAAYFERIRAPEKRLVWFEGSGHNPPFEEPERFVATLVEEVLPLAVDVSAGPAANAR
jgi:pimeloyl-ACP methyl ester carboxylesterase